MAIVKEAYNALEAIVGSRYISDDRGLCEGYRSGPGGYESGLGYERVMTTIPGAVILPRTTEDVQKIDDVVVIGYGTQKKADLTGSVASVAPEKLEARKV